MVWLGWMGVYAAIASLVIVKTETAILVQIQGHLYLP